MRENIKARWTARLRSGQDQQGTGYLKIVEEESTRYCCLGVLCEIAVEDGIVLPSTPIDRGCTFHTFMAVGDSEDCNYTVLPMAVADWADISADGYQRWESEDLPPCDNRPEGENSCGNFLCGNCKQLALTELNDGDNAVPYSRSATFAEIADVIEKWF